MVANPLSFPPLALLLLSGTFASSQPPAPQKASHLQDLPSGTTLPVSIDKTLRAGRTPVGTPFTARTTQRIPLPGNVYLPPGATLSGTVVVSTRHPSVLALRFTTLRSPEGTVPLAVRTLAAAGFVALSSIHDPANGSTDRGNSNPASWTTAQVGGDQVVRSQWSGPVINDRTETVGFADFNGIYGNPVPPSTTPLALGPFSVSARGLFGFSPDCALTPAASTTLQCTASSATLRHGGALFLEVTRP